MHHYIFFLLFSLILDRYEAKMKREILRATDLPLTEVPCQVKFPPDEVSHEVELCL